MKNDKTVVVASSDKILNDIFLNEKISGVKIILDEGKTDLDDINIDAVFMVESGSDKSDAFLIKKWVGHNHMRYVKKETTPEKTACSLKKEIEFFAVSEYETEKKFLIKYPDINFLKSLFNCKEIEIEQVYLKSDNKCSRRIRKRTVSGKTLLYYTQKKQITDLVREEKEVIITPEEYELLKVEKAPECEIITKKRFCLLHNGYYLEIDVFPFMKNTAVLEIELKEENDEFLVPEYIEIIEDVTKKREFTNYNMSKKLKINPDFYHTL